MEPLTIVWILLAIVILLVFFKFIKRLFSVALSTVGIIAVVWLMIAALRYADETKLRDNLIASNNIFLLSDKGSIITGFATDGTMIDTISLTDYTDPESSIYDRYYKVIVVDKGLVPDLAAEENDAADRQHKTLMFESYIKNELLPEQGDNIDFLIDKERQGLIEVHRETLAFRHGLLEVLGV